MEDVCWFLKIRKQEFFILQLWVILKEFIIQMIRTG